MSLAERESLNVLHGIDTSAALQDLENVVGDVVAAAGTIAYSGPFTPVFRQLLLAEWSNVLKDAGVPYSAGTSLIKTLQVQVAAEQMLLLFICARASSCDHPTLLRTSLGVPDSSGSLCFLIAGSCQGPSLESCGSAH